jgi:uncharacterized protein (DUF427 family)
MKDRRRIEPGPGQESVWDYPRPPRVEDSSKRVMVVFNGVTIADTTRARRVLETSHPPVYYVPAEDVRSDLMTQTGHSSFCEWKGRAGYYAVEVGGRRSENAAWFYPSPTPAFASIRDCVAFYPSRVDACYVDGERVRAQAGDFYGGWVTDEIVGPFKGGPGTWGW